MEHREQKGVDEKRSHPHFEYPIVGKSKAVDHLIKQISNLAKTRRDVLIVGESGTGKGAVAKDIFIGGKAFGGDGSFLSVNLSVIDDRELEALLAGRDNKVGPGASATPRRTPLDQPEGGTIVFEELEEASFRNQRKVLTFISERKSGTTFANLRVIVTLKDSVQNLVADHKLMAEVGQKLMEFEAVTIPPLRDRQEDIPLLVKHFAAELCKEMGCLNWSSISMPWMC